MSYGQRSQRHESARFLDSAKPGQAANFRLKDDMVSGSPMFDVDSFSSCCRCSQPLTIALPQPHHHAKNPQRRDDERDLAYQATPPSGGSEEDSIRVTP